MRVQLRSVIAFAVPVAFAVALACTDGPYDNECASLGGACVTSETQCNGTLPFSCTVGVCCYPLPASGDAAPPPSSDATMPSSHMDATTSDATVDDDTGTGDVGTSDDTSSPGDDSTMEATVPDQSAPEEAGDDTGTGDAGTDSGAPDASTKDAGTDASTKDAAAHDGAVTDAPTSDAAPMCPGFSPPTTIDLCTACTLITNPACQVNGCFGGYYCETTGLKCVAPSKVTCDAGM